MMVTPLTEEGIGLNYVVTTGLHVRVGLVPAKDATFLKNYQTEGLLQQAAEDLTGFTDPWDINIYEDGSAAELSYESNL